LYFISDVENYNRTSCRACLPSDSSQLLQRYQPDASPREHRE